MAIAQLSRQTLKITRFQHFLGGLEDAELKSGNLKSLTRKLSSPEGAQGIFSKITFSKSVHSNKKDDVCHSFLVKIFIKSLHRGGVIGQTTNSMT